MYSYQLNEQGYLTDWQAWQPSIAEQLATAEGLQLNSQHWQLIYFLRQFYSDYKNFPPVRGLVKKLQETGPASSALLYELFPAGPLKQASKIAGLPRPARCV